MGPSPTELRPSTSNLRVLLAYVADLELEVDRLRKQGQFVQHHVRESLKQIQRLSGEQSRDGDAPRALGEVAQATRQLAAVLRDLQEPAGYHPAHDQVTAIAVRPLAEQVFRWPQRLQGAADTVLRLELESEHVDWCPARLRHILDNLISNALRYRAPRLRGARRGQRGRAVLGRARRGAGAVLPGGPRAGGRPRRRPGRGQPARGGERADPYGGTRAGPGGPPACRPRPT